MKYSPICIDCTTRIEGNAYSSISRIGHVCERHAEKEWGETKRGI